MLSLRRELARITRNRPDLDGLPEQAGTEEAIRAWRGAAYRVRESSKQALLAATQLHEHLPERPEGVEQGTQVAEELQHVRSLLERIGGELERLADELTLVVEHQRARAIGAGSEGAGTRSLAEVLRGGEGALKSLDQLAQVGERALHQLGGEGEGAVEEALRSEEAQVLADAEVGRLTTPADP